jgi:hypothetical protein
VPVRCGPTGPRPPLRLFEDDGDGGDGGFGVSGTRWRRGPGPHPVGAGRSAGGHWEPVGCGGVGEGIGVGVLLGVRVAGVGGWAKSFG